MGDWHLTKKETSTGSKWRHLEEWHFTTPQEKEVSFTMSAGFDIVVVFGITKNKDVLIIEEYYPSLQQKVPTLVAGFVEDDSPEQTAVRELKEETGYVADQVVHLGKNVRGKYETGKLNYFLALDIEKKGEQNLEETEDIDVKLISIDEVKKLVRDSKIEDVVESACIYRALDYLGEL